MLAFNATKPHISGQNKQKKIPDNTAISSRTPLPNMRKWCMVENAALMWGVHEIAVKNVQSSGDYTFQTIPSSMNVLSI